MFHQANQGICILNYKSEIIYANAKAKRVFGKAAPGLYQQLRGVCRQFMVMVKEKETLLSNYSGMLNQQLDIITFNCFSFYSEEQTFVMVVFDYRAGDEINSANGITFTSREKDILHAIAAGKTNKEISETLSIGFETVKSHVRNLLAKTGTTSRTELIGKCCHSGNDAWYA
ncbi:LuxR C-terminal-related transcriptional regulator [Sporomusa rhizae]|uniref:helix-turn-helix transcriptional regulator n=1 Tax=Sporomusa rhizae TaxID=357999 RepID=UPI00352AA52B